MPEDVLVKLVAATGLLDSIVNILEFPIEDCSASVEAITKIQEIRSILGMEE